MESTVASGTCGGTAKTWLSHGRWVPPPASTLLSANPLGAKTDTLPPDARHASADTGIRPPFAKITQMFDTRPKPTSQKAGTRTFTTKNARIMR